MNTVLRLAVLGLLAITLNTGIQAQGLLQTFPGSLGVDGGDVDQDGIPDLIIANGSITTVYSGKDWSTLHTLQITTLGLSNITALAGGADINQDGYDDIVTGQSGAYQFANRQHAGIVKAWSGKDGTILYEIGGLWGGDRLGTSVAVLGDLNQDGFPDFAAGAQSAPVGQDYGIVMVWSGKDGRLLYLFTGTAVPQRLGYSLAAAGDVDNDGVQDIISGSQQRGMARVYSGKTGAQLHLFIVGGIDVFVDGLGDVNNDGHSDLLIGSGGNVVIKSGKDGSTLHTKPGITGSVAGDMDLDGYADFIVLSAGVSPALRIVEAFSGKDGSRLLLLSEPSLAGFGSFTRLVGDINNDGARDILVGAPSSVRLYGGSILPFSVDKTELSISQGGTQTMVMDAGVQHGLKIYGILGSDLGTSPGFQLGPLSIPLNPGLYLTYTFDNPNTIIQQSFSVLDGDGKGSAVLTLPNNIPNSLVGTNLHHAFIVMNLAPFSFDLVSNTVVLKLVQ